MAWHSKQQLEMGTCAGPASKACMHSRTTVAGGNRGAGNRVPSRTCPLPSPACKPVGSSPRLSPPCPRPVPPNKHTCTSQPPQVQYSDARAARDLLRSGAFSGLRASVRALGDYSVLNGTAADASSLASGFFRSLEAFDQVLNTAVR